MFNPVKSVQTVSQFTASLKGLIETAHPFVGLQGEVSNLRIPYSGHMYFILKDDKAQIRAVLFKGQRRFLQSDFKDGDQIICRGRITVYEPRGDYQIIVDSVERAGHGRMHLNYAALKEKLKEEGLFAEELKQPIPDFVQKVCLITSPTGAAVHDFLEIALQKHPQLQVEITATAMQGEQAPAQIQTAIHQACKKNWADVIVLCRGGGSIEDLWGFNNEDLARAIASSPLPVVSAIGHEVDFTIADFVADLRAPTPSAAAEMIVPDLQQIKERLATLQEQLCQSITTLLMSHENHIHQHIKSLGDPRSILDQQQLRVDHLITQLELEFSGTIPTKKEGLSRLLARLNNVSPEQAVERMEHRFNELQSRLILALGTILQANTERLQRSALVLNSLSPLAVLGRGYSISTNTTTGKLISMISEVQPQDVLSIKLQDGTVQAEATTVLPDVRGD